MDLDLAASFVAVADAGSITAAAQRTHISQSALSRRLQQLEAELEVQLLHRGRHGAVLTDAGQLVVEDCRALISRYESMRRDLDDLLGLRRGTVVLGGGATDTSMLLPAAIAAFRSDHPGIHFVVTEAGSRQVMDDVATGRLQLGVVTLPASNPDVVCVPLVEDEIVLVARIDDPLPAKATPDDLRDRGLIVFEAGSAIRRIVDGALAGAGVDVKVAMELRSVTTMLQMVAATGDLAFVSRLTLGSADGLRVVPVAGLRIVRTLALATRRGQPLPPAAQAFASSLKQRASGQR